VSIDIKEEANGTYQSKVCQLNYQILPVLGNVHDFTTYFWKNPIAIRDDLEATNTDVSKFYHEALKKLSWQDGMKKIQAVAEERCMCEDPKKQDSRHTSCRTYQDVYGVDRHWCWVRHDRQANVYKACEEIGYKLFYDETRKKIWTEDICKKQACKCSGIGMRPVGKQQDHNTSLLEGNTLNFGGTCRKWRQHDQTEWCYAGFDSTCSDRKKTAEQWVGKNGEKQWMQYEAELPCDKENQEDLVEAARSLCLNITIPTETLFFISVLLYIPMIVIIFKFLSNRCGDECDLDDQFAVVLTSDDESEDEWAGGGAKKEDEGAATQPMTQ